MSNILEIEKIDLARGGLQILSQLTFNVREGHITSLIGPNGAGKTTAFNAISGFMRADSGKIRFEGRNVAGMLPEKLTSMGLARTFQRVRGLPSLTVRDNLVIGALNRTNSVRKARERADELLQALHLSEIADTIASSLPIGTRKILEVGRVLSTKPKLVLLDEVMGGLGPAEVKIMVEFIRALPAQGVTVLLVEHHMEAVMSVSDRIIAINRGKNLAEGTPAEIASHPDVIEAYLGGGVDDGIADAEA